MPSAKEETKPQFSDPAMALVAEKKARYNKMRKQLKESITKRNALEEEVTKLEEDIYDKETQYLEDGVINGNIVKGFQNFSKTSSSSTSRARKIQFSDEDRIFSLSSSTYVTHLQRMKQESGSRGLTPDTPSLEEDEEFSSEIGSPRK